MKNVYTTYSYIVKEAIAPLALAGSGLRAAYGGASAALNLPGIGRGWYNAGSDIAHGAGRIRDTVYGTFNPFEDEASRQNSVAHSIGKELGSFFLPKVYDPDDLGPYEEYSNYIKDTEEGEMLLREAAELRRQARIFKRKKKREEQERDHAAASRYF